ncbi:MAG: hypothetical protein R3D58_09275 [Saprospiraceae bacterium]|jgi:hypothetical protein|nr:hypothetical protein [Lewinellaceae bacterium]
MAAQAVNFQIYQDVNKLIALLHEVTAQFPVNYQRTLGQEIQRGALKVVNSVHQLNKCPGMADCYYQLQDDLEVLKLNVAFGFRLSLIDTSLNTLLTQLIRCISAQITGWPFYKISTGAVQGHKIGTFPN